MSAQHDNIHELADEYVLGLLDPVEQAQVERRVETDAAMRAAVAASRDRFAELDASTVVAAPETLWQRIDAALGSSAGASPVAPAEGVRPASNDNRLWRPLALAAMAATVLLAVGLGWSVTNRPEPQVVAILVDTSGAPLAVVEDFAGSSARVTLLTDFPVPAGKTMQVWTLPSQDIGPVSLGLLEAARSVVLEGPDLPQPREDQLYEITVENEGGSPTGRPTGPILVKGFAKLPR